MLLCDSTRRAGREFDPAVVNSDNEIYCIGCQVIFDLLCPRRQELGEDFQTQSAQLLTAFSLGGDHMVVKLADLFRFEMWVATANNSHLFANCDVSLRCWRPSALLAILGLPPPQLTHHVVPGYKAVVAEALSE